MYIEVSDRKTLLPDGGVCVAVEIEGKIYQGVGCNSKTAKCAAAKYALRGFATFE